MKKIIFHPKSKEADLLVDKPVTANKHVPDWYKKIPRFSKNKFKVNDKGVSNSTVKMCIPFLDAFISGYIQHTWCDIYIESESNGIKYKYSSLPQIINHREENSDLPIPDIFYPTEFVWQMQWIPELPRGYSMLYTHPLNRLDLPFYSLSGIVDSDSFNIESAANHPFYIKNNFSGLIPAGTPIVQMIPFKRDSWRSEFAVFDENRQILSQNNFKYFFGNYKNNFWSKKEFK